MIINVTFSPLSCLNLLVFFPSKFFDVLQTRELIDDLKSSSGLEMQGSRSKLGADSKTLLRILCHRSESEASQFVKKQYKIPKSAA